MSNIYDSVNKRKAKEINIKEILLILKKRLWIIMGMTIITTSLGLYYSHTSYVPLYQTSSRIIIGATPDKMNTFQVIIKDIRILEKVVKNLGLSQTPESLAGQITVASIDSSQVVSISVTDSDPERGAKIANTTAEVYKEEIPSIMKFDGEVSILSQAKAAVSPINQNENRKVIIAAIIGIVIGLGIVFLLDSLDESVRSERDIEAELGLPVLGKVSKVNKRNIKKKYHRNFELEVRGEYIGYK